MPNKDYAICRCERSTGGNGGRAPDFASVRDALLRREPNLSDGVFEIAEHLVEHPYEVAFGNVRAIASRFGVSTATIVRLAQSLGFDGFRDMRVAFGRTLKDAYKRGAVAGSN